MTATMLPPVISPEDMPLHDRALTISVNLLPDEVRAARTNRSARRIVAAVLVAAVAATGGWYYYAQQQTSAASDQLSQAQQDVVNATHRQHSFAGLTTTKAEITKLQTTLAAATKGDVDWSRLIPALEHVLPRGVALTGITGNAAAADQTTGTAALGSAGGSTPATGKLLLTGLAATKGLIADYSLALRKVSGLSGSQITSVQLSKDPAGFTFSIQVNTNAKALSTRYAKAGK